MTDYPRFESVKGSPDTAYRAYYGARSVDLVFWLVDWWRGMPRVAAPAFDPAGGAIEIHERLPTRSLADSRLAAIERTAPVHASSRLSLDESFSGEFIFASARTQKLQAGVLIAFVAILVVIVAQGIRSPQFTGMQTAQNPKHLTTSPISIKIAGPP